MTRHVALLRGVNVNGIAIRSADLRKLFVELGTTPPSNASITTRNLRTVEKLIAE